MVVYGGFKFQENSRLILMVATILPSAEQQNHLILSLINGGWVMVMVMVVFKFKKTWKFLHILVHTILPFGFRFSVFGFDFAATHPKS